METETLPPENAAVPATSEIDFDALSDDERTYIIESGGELPPSVAARQAAALGIDPDEEAAVADTEKKPDEADTAVEEPTEEPDKEEPEKLEEETKEEEPAPVVDEELATRVANFKFTDEADEEVRRREEAEYRELAELPEAVESMISWRDARIAELSEAAVETDQVTHQTMDAFNQMLSFKQNEEGKWVANTDAVRTLMQQHYPTEYAQLVEDVLSEPSPKYTGFTRLQEFVRDGFQLPDDAMRTLDTFLHSGGKMPTPSFVPPGVDPRVAEAYWNARNRDDLAEQCDRWTKVLDDDYASDDEKNTAARELEYINSDLARSQKGFDADRSRDQERASGVQRFQQEVFQAGSVNYKRTTIELLRQGAAELEPAMPFASVGAKLASAGLAVLVNSAFSDVDEYAKDAQRIITDAGVKVNWAQVGTTIAKLWDTEQKIAALEKTQGINPRAIELAQRSKKDVLLELKGFTKNVVGNLNRILATDAGLALKAKIANAGKVSVVRPKIRGNQVPQRTRINFDDMPHDELKEIVFGNKPLPSQV